VEEIVDVHGCVLAIDTAMNCCSVAVLDPVTKEGHSKCEPMNRGQAERLVPMVLEVMREAGREMQEISLISVTRGPGAFTGLRIGLAAAKSFALAVDATVIGLTTLEMLANQYFERNFYKEKSLLVLIDTKRDDYYYQLFSPDGKPVIAPGAGNAENILKLLPEDFAVIGDAGKKGHEFVNPVSLAGAGYKYYKLFPDEYSSDPLYIRDADVSTSGKQGREVKQKI